jgi:hypothetical protein
MKSLLRRLLCVLFTIFCMLWYMTMQPSTRAHRFTPNPLDVRCEVLFGILSAPNNNFWRSLMRNNWISHLPPRYCYRFFIGNPPAESRRDLEKEQLQHGDLVYLPMQDSYTAISIKTTGIANWVRKLLIMHH